MGTPVTITLSWDQPNHQFLISYTNNLTHVTTKGKMLYDFSDTTPVAGPAKILGVSGQPSNCTANSTFVYSDALFDQRLHRSMSSETVRHALRADRLAYRSWRKIASLTMSAMSSGFRANSSMRSKKSAISLEWMFCSLPTEARS